MSAMRLLRFIVGIPALEEMTAYTCSEPFDIRFGSTLVYGDSNHWTASVNELDGADRATITVRFALSASEQIR